MRNPPSVGADPCVRPLDAPSPRLAPTPWIPAFAGMTELCKGLQGEKGQETPHRVQSRVFQRCVTGDVG